MASFRVGQAIPIAALFALSVVATGAQGPAAAPAGQARSSVITVPDSIPRVSLAAGRSLVLSTPFEITRVAVTNPAVADATVVAPTEILIDGKSAGTVTLIVWGQNQRLQYDVVVDRGTSELQLQLQQIFPGEDLQVSQTVDAVILTGHASTNEVMLRVGEVAAAVSPKSKILNLLQLPGGNASQQVMLQVRIAEVNRRAATELGASIFTGGTGVKNIIARGTTQQFTAPEFEGLTREATGGDLISSSGNLTFSDFLNLFVFSNKYNVGALIRALQTSGNFQSLAEPNLIAYNGQEATFLAGGELPIPVVQGTAGTVSVQYKEFGIRLSFRPTIAGDVIRLHVAPEVSSLDSANGVSLGGYRIPALTTRRAETDVELRDGQSFAIAGLLNSVAQESRQAVPLLSRLPIIGVFFKSKTNNQDRTELMVLVTPRLVRPMNPDEVPPLPTMEKRFLPAPDAAASAPGQDAPAPR
ncbi:MAG: type II and III secretion system protein family protein [Vicinamibacterales bacterium]